MPRNIPMAVAKEAPKSPIQVIERMMRLLDVLAEHPEPIGLKQIAQSTGLHPSTAHRILAAMNISGQAARTSETQIVKTFLPKLIFLEKNQKTLFFLFSNF